MCFIKMSHYPIIPLLPPPTKSLLPKSAPTFIVCVCVCVWWWGVQLHQLGNAQMSKGLVFNKFLFLQRSHVFPGPVDIGSSTTWHLLSDQPGHRRTWHKHNAQQTQDGATPLRCLSGQPSRRQSPFIWWVTKP